MSRRSCARRPSRVCLFMGDQMGTHAADIYGRMSEEMGPQEVGAGLVAFTRTCSVRFSSRTDV